MFLWVVYQVLYRKNNMGQIHKFVSLEIAIEIITKLRMIEGLLGANQEKLNQNGFLYNVGLLVLFVML